MVSVLMVTWNGGSLLGPSVAAVLGQTWRDLELILVDNGSTDGAVETLAAQPDARLRIIRPGRNLGIAAGTNLAMSHARGRYLAVVDHDDLMRPEKLARQVAWLEAHPLHGGVASRARLIDRDGADKGPEFTLHNADEHRTFTQFSQAANFGTHLFRREVLAALPRREAFPFSSDFDFVARAVERWPVTALPEVLFDYRIHPGQTTQRRRREQIVAECMIRVLTWRRRAGLPENLGEVTRELGDVLAALPEAAAIYRACIAYCRKRDMPLLAAYHARKLLGVSRHPMDWLRGFRAGAFEADPEATKVFWRGPLAAYRLRPWPA